MEMMLVGDPITAQRAGGASGTSPISMIDPDALEALRVCKTAAHIIDVNGGLTHRRSGSKRER
jgi:hypothetical protein